MGTSGVQYFFVKDPLPKGLSYPLKRSVLDAALGSAGVTSVFGVRYRGALLSWLLRVGFDPDHPRGLPAGKVSITVGAVPSDERRATMKALEARLPEVCEWIRRTETAAQTWRMTQHDVVIEIRGDQALLVEDRDL